MDNTNPPANPNTPTSNYIKGSVLHRFIANFIDGIILIIIATFISLISTVTKLNALTFLNFPIQLLYGILFIGTSGSTPGMKLLKLKAVTTNYQNVTMTTSVIRELASILSSLIMGLGYYWALIDKKRQTWHDKLAKTYVVKLDNNNNLIPAASDDVISTGQKILFGLAALIFPGLALLGILLAITLIALNPAKQFAQANNTKRTADINAIANAVLQYKAGHNNQLPQGITNTPGEISSQNSNLCPDLVPNYIVALPVDPKINTKEGTVSNCQSPYDTGYTISVDSQGLITISAPKSEINTPISITR